MSDRPGPGRDEGEAAHGAEAEPSRSLAQWALDLFVYAPAGLALTAVEDLPELASKGRRRVETQVRNARFVGELALRMGRRDLQSRVGHFVARGRAPEVEVVVVEPAPEPPEASAPAAPEAPEEVGVAPSVSEPAAPSRATSGSGEVDLVIADYDALSASQVVRRLEGLGTTELEAVYRHEAGHRGRRTILHRAQQLLGTAGPPGGRPPAGGRPV